MTTPFVNPNGQGLVVDRVGRNTANIGNVTDRAFIKGVGRSMINNSTSAQGVFGADVDLMESLNLKKNALRRVVMVATQHGDALNKSTGVMAANVNLATTANENLYDEVTQINIRPAGNVYNNGVTPKSSETFSVVRQYDSETKGNEVVIKAEAIKMLKQIEHNLYNDTPLYSNRKGVTSQALDEKRRNEAVDLAKTLKQIIGTKFSFSQTELMLAIEQAVYDAVRRNGVDAALLESSEELADSLIQAGFKGDVVQYLRETHTFDAFCQDYCRRIVKNMFMLTKRPEDTVKFLSGVSDLFSRNLTSGKTFVDAMRVRSQTMGEMPVEKVLFVGEQTLTQIPGVEPAERSGTMAMGYYDNSKFYTQSNRAFVKLNEAGNQVESSTPSYADLLALKDDKNLNLDGTIMNLTPLSRRIFSLDNELDEEDIAAQESSKLYDVPVMDRCQILPGKEGAIALNVRRMNRMGPYGNEEPDMSRSSKAMTNLVMCAKMGDNDLSDPDLYNWPELMLSDKGYQNGALRKFGVSNIITKTETVSPKTVKFTGNHMAQAFADPSLWDFSQDALTNLNKFMSRRMNSQQAGFTDFFRYFQTLLDNFHKKKELAVDFYKYGSKEAGSALLSLEYTPFHELDVVTAAGQTTLQSKQRRHIGSLPGWLVDPKHHIAFGNLLAKDKAALNTLKTTFEELTRATMLAGAKDDPATNALPADVKDYKFGPEKLIGILQELMKAAFSKVEKIEDVASINPHEILAYVIAPVFFTTGEYKVVPSATSKIVQDGKMNWDATDTQDVDKYHLANISAIASDTNLTQMTKLLTLLGMMRKINPQSMIHSALANYPTGLSLDIVKVEKLYNNSMMMATPKAVDVICTPQPVQTQQRGNGDMAFKMSVRVQSVNNMAGGSCITIPNATPSVRIDHVATDFDNNPHICLDHISTSTWGVRGGLKAWLAQLATTNIITQIDATLMENVLKESETYRMKIMNAGRSRPHVTDSYQLFLRPAGDLMKNHELSAYMGVPRYCCLTGEYSKIPAVNFYSRMETTNPWLSHLGAVYNQWYVNGTQIIRGGSGTRDMKDAADYMVTVTINPTAPNLSETTLLLQNAFDFETYEESNLDPFQERVVEDHLNYRAGVSNNKPREIAVTRGNPPSDKNYLSFAHPLARMGMAVTATAYSNETIRRETRKAGVPVKSDYIGRCVISPISA